MNKKILIPIIILVLLLAGGVIFFVSKNKDKNAQGPDLVQTPPQINKVNDLALSKRPFVELIPHANPARCGGVDMKITNFKNNETKAEYELEYTTDKMIQAVFGNRSFIETVEHSPLEFGTCSKGKCKCDDENITGGNLKLILHGDQEYTLKENFSYYNIGEAEGFLTSFDKRLTIETGKAFSQKTSVIVSSTFGLPAELNDKVIKGPYAMFIEDFKIGDQLDNEINYILQAKEAETGKIQGWDGSNWQVLDSQYSDGKATFSSDKLLVLVLTE